MNVTKVTEDIIPMIKSLWNAIKLKQEVKAVLYVKEKGKITNRKYQSFPVP